MEPHGSTRRIGATASAAVTDLAHATTALDDPTDLYPLIGELLGSLRSLVQIADQLAHAHMRHRGRARSDDGDAALGAREADGAAWALVRTRELLDAAEGAADLASQDSGRVAWAPVEKSERWLNVIFLQGADAVIALDILQRSGPRAAIRHLAQQDYGDETTESALVNGYVYEGIPAGPTDHISDDRVCGYALIHNPRLGYVSLLRRFPGGPDDEEPSSPRADARTTPSRTPIHPVWTGSRGAKRTPARSVAL
ncbi:hypothetical protein SAMN04487846_3320 [Microbacterium sp. cf046]|nr:hypothetical protein SAMN04487846_3320 [Microbacterium sp. cf046]